LTSPQEASLYALRQELEALTHSLDLLLVERFCDVVAATIEAHGSLYIIGNGGSAALANHLATDLIKVGLEAHRVVKAFSLAEESAMLTALANDYGFKSLFSKRLATVLESTDVVMAISTSGESVNVLEALRLARSKQVGTLGLTGPSHARMRELCELSFSVESSYPYVIESLHLSFTQLLAASLRLRLGLKLPVLS